MEQRKYDLATARALFELVGFPDSWEVKDDGIFVTDEYRALSPKDEGFDWIPAYDMDWPSAPNPMTAPVLPIPFTASELAACMLDGCGRGIQDAVDNRIGYALNGEALKHFTLGSRWAREALQSAYSLAEKAQAEVGTFDYDEERKDQKLQQQAEDADDEANTREGVFESEIKNDEANRRRRTAIASVAELKARAQQSNASIKGKWFAWRKAMVHHLLQPQQAETQAEAATEPVRAMQRTAAQDTAILSAIKQAGYNPLSLPINEKGKPGVKAAMREALKDNLLFVGSTVFNKAWARLRESGDVANSD